MPIWTDAVTNALRRHVTRTGSPLFTRRELIAAEIGAIEAETRTHGRTPTQTLGRELQQLRDTGHVEFLERGSYRWLGERPESEPATATKGIFLLPASADWRHPPETLYPLPLHWTQRDGHKLGIFVCASRPTRGIVQEAASHRLVETEFGRFPALQIFTLEDLFDGRVPHLPPLVSPNRRAARVETRASHQSGAQGALL